MVFYGIFWSGQYSIASFPISLVLGLCLIILPKILEYGNAILEQEF